jgi:hypothetical protein
MAIDQLIARAVDTLRAHGYAVGDRYMIGCAGYVKVDGVPLPDQQVLLLAEQLGSKPQ